MSVHVVDELCKISQGSGVVVVEGKTRQEVTSAEARALAINWAQTHGIGRAGIGAVANTYPIDSDGKTDNGLITGERSVAAFRSEISVNAGL